MIGPFSRVAAWSGRFLLCAAAAAVILTVMVALSSIVTPVLIALLISAMGTPFTLWLRRHGVSKVLSAGITALIATAIFALVIAIVVGTVVAQADNIASAVGSAADQITAWLQSGPLHLPADKAHQIQGDAGSLWAHLAALLVTGAVRLVSGGVSLIGGLLLAIVFVLYFLATGDGVWQWLIGWANDEHRPRIDRVGRRCWSLLSYYGLGTLIVGCCDAVGIGLGLWIMGVPLVLPIMVLTVFAEFIPIFGTLVASAIAILVAFANNGLATAIILLFIIIPVQQFNAHFTSPFVVGRSIKVHPLVVLLAVTIGIALAGFLGGLLALPVAAVVGVLLGELRGASTEEVEPAGTQPDTAAASAAVVSPQP